MLIGWNGETLPALPLEREIELVAAAGYDGLEVFVPKLAPYLAYHSAAALRRSLEDRGLAPLAMNGVENINLRSPTEFAGVREECRWLAEISSAIGCPTIVLVPSPSPAGMAWDEVKKQTVAALNELAATVEPYGVRLALEFLAPAACSVRTLAQGLEIVQAVARPSVGLVVDTYHFYVGGSRWESLEAMDITRVMIVHINDVENLPLDRLTDADRLLPGEGILPLGRMLLTLHGKGYRGAYSLEVMRPAYRDRDPAEYSQAGIGAVRRAFSQAGMS